jgi:hypothetical protein
VNKVSGFQCYKINELNNKKKAMLVDEIKKTWLLNKGT